LKPAPTPSPHREGRVIGLPEGHAGGNRLYRLEISLALALVVARIDEGDITLAPVPAFSHALIARLSGSSPCLAITFSDMRTFAPKTMSAFSPIARAAASGWAKSML
jgi:hypothetical protein